MQQFTDLVVISIHLQVSELVQMYPPLSDSAAC